MFDSNQYEYLEFVPSKGWHDEMIFFSFPYLDRCFLGAPSLLACVYSKAFLAGDRYAGICALFPHACATIDRIDPVDLGMLRFAPSTFA